MDRSASSGAGNSHQGENSPFEPWVQTLLQAAPVGYWWKNPNTRQCEFSGRFQQLLGYEATSDALADDHFSDLIHPSDHERLLRAIESDDAYHQQFSVVLRLLMSDGEYRWFRLHGVLATDGLGCRNLVSGWIETAEDVDQPIQDRNALHLPITRKPLVNLQCQSVFWDLYNDSPVMQASIHSQDGTILHCNQTLADRLQYTPEELLGKHFSTFCASESKASLEKAIRESPEQSDSGEVLLSLCTRNTDLLPILLSVKPIFDQHEKLLAANCTFRDLSVQRDDLHLENEDLRKREQDSRELLQRQVNDLEQLTYVASHDLKAPLHGIRMVTTWLREDCYDVLPAESKLHLDELERRVNRMDQLLKGILDYARAGRLDQTCVEIDCQKLFEDVVESIQRPSDFRIDLPKDLPVINGMVSPLYRVVQNIVSNAVLHHQGNQGRLRIRWKRVGDYVQFRFRDNGPGIEERYHERIFQMFQTLRPRDEQESSGIGLAIVQRLVEGVGGHIRVKSKIDQGSQFVLTWPGYRESAPTKTS